jgi:hypothetical protein
MPTQRPPDLDAAGQPIDGRPPDLDAEGHPIFRSEMARDAAGKPVVREAIASSLPVIGGLTGAIAGTTFGVPGGVVGAALGAMGGHGYGEVLSHATELPGAIADIGRNLWAGGEPRAATVRTLTEGRPYADAALQTGIVGAKAAALQLAAEGVGAGIQAIPRTARAGQTFETVMAAAKDVPVNMEGPGQVALRIQQLAERGATMPSPVRKFLLRITDPEKGDMLYPEARDFASNISRLSAKDWQGVNPTVGREIMQLRVALNQAVGQAAEVVGKGEAYAAAMKEYAQAAKLKAALNASKDALIKHILPASGAIYAYEKAKGLLSGK